MKQKPTDTANGKLVICLGSVSIIKLKFYIAKTDKKLLPLFLLVFVRSLMQVPYRSMTELYQHHPFCFIYKRSHEHLYTHRD